MKKYLKRKMTISHILFASVFYALTVTILEDYFNWDNRYISGVFGGFVTILGYMLARLIIRKKE
ncbi:hypothetical protein [Gottfriedia acidiceleris]|uniref:hypothetical protein n=1 Tax=Gottfriedia acidiceleris TaxID=371036 RepID=UPI003D1EFA24